MVTVVVEAQLFTSVIVTVYVPAERLLAVAELPPLGAHAYVNGPVPPVIVPVADPLFPPLHETFVLEAIDATPPDVLETAAVTVNVHALRSVTVTVYVPASMLVIVCVVCPPGCHR